MPLDLPTVTLTAALEIAFSGLLLATAPRHKGQTFALVVWGMAMVIGAAGLTMPLLLARWLGAATANLTVATLLLATATSWTAARVFRERPASVGLILAGPAVWLATQYWLGAAPQWNALPSLIGALYTAATAMELWLTRPERLQSRRAAIVLLAVHAGIYLVRAAALLDGNVLSAHATSLLVLESLLHTNGMAFLLLGMVKERLELRSNETLRALSRLDGLTGIGNRRFFDEQLDVELDRAAQGSAALALLLIDVDHFKAYNDAAGHQQGDVCLRQVAQSIANHVDRPGDLAARYGGEEFAVVMADTDPKGALVQAERMRQAVERMAIDHPGTGEMVTVSIGVATVLPQLGQMDASELVRQADRCLYAAKAAGRNTVKADWEPGRAAIGA